MNYYCYFNGKILKKADIQVGIYDLVMIRGYGVFDFFRTYHGTAFRLPDYLDRFVKSARKMQLKLPVNRKEIAGIVELLLQKNKASDKRDFGIRFLLTGGYSLDAYLPAVTPNLFVLIEDLPHYPSWWSEKGIKLMLHEHKRELSVVKTTNYLTAINLARERRKYKAHDTLYCYNGKVLETTRNNFFLFHRNTLVTADENVLQGVTRKILLKLARLDKRFSVEIRPILLNELTKCSECFITGTTRGITPVVQIDDKKIGNGRVGENTKIMVGLFDEFVSKECKR